MDLTRPAQKAAEVEIAQYALRHLGIDGQVSNGADPPDVIASTLSDTLAIEVIEYHRSEAVAGDYTRRQIEERWRQIQEKSYEYICGNSPDLAKLNVYLNIRDMQLPSRSEEDVFISEVIDMVLSVQDRALHDPIELAVDARHTGLVNYLRSVTVEKIEAIAMWDSNLPIGRVGINDEELTAFLGRKLNLPRPNGFGQFWLLVAGGENISQTMAVMSLQQLQSFSRLNQRLETSNFDQVHIIDQLGYFVWATDVGWRVCDRVQDPQ